MKGKSQRLLLGLVACLCLVLSGGPAWAESGVSADKILVGGIADLSGPAAAMGKGIVDGAKLYFRSVNENGGVHGRKIEYMAEDDGFQSPRAVQACKKLITREDVFCFFMVMGSAQINAMYPLLEAKGIPLVVAATQSQEMAVPPRKYLFLADVTYTEQGKLAVEWLVEDKGAKNAKLACIYQDDTPGHDWLNGVTIGAKHYGLDLVKLPYKRGDVDFSSQVAKCKEAGVTHILQFTMIREPGIIFKEAQRLQYKPTVVCAHPAMHPGVLKLAGDSVQNLSGLYLTSFMLDPATETSDSLEAFRALCAKYKTVDPRNTYALYGYQAAMVLVEGFKRAGKNLTRDGLVKALESFAGYDNGIIPPITWSAASRGGKHAAVKIFQADAGRWVSITKGWRASKIQ